MNATALTCNLPATLSYQEVQEKHGEAWKALPEAYKEDSCLTFFLDCHENLCALHDLGGECMWDDSAPLFPRWIRTDLNLRLAEGFIFIS